MSRDLPLHSSLGNKSEIPTEKTKKNINKVKLVGRVVQVYCILADFLAALSINY